MATSVEIIIGFELLKNTFLLELIAQAQKSL